jgi:SAM-dependent methyltransferase
VINSTGVADLNAFLASNTARVFLSAQRLVDTRILETEEAHRAIETLHNIGSGINATDIGMLVEHEKVPFPSYPYEWSPEMLFAAACLTLDLADALLAEGLGPKDATPYNIMYRGPGPVFIDILSFERRLPGDTRWLPYGQFVRTFLIPLLLNKYFGISLRQIFTTDREGIEPEDVYRLCGFIRRLMPPFLTLVTVPTWLGARHDQDNKALYQRRVLAHSEKAEFILASLFRHLRRVTRKLQPDASRQSTWSNYSSSASHYSAPAAAVKRAFIEDVMAEIQPRNVLDIGCNAGDFSTIAAQRGAQVVAIDCDPVVVDRVWYRVASERLAVLPLVVNISHPSPGIGWRNRECLSFLERARGAFDAVLMLAVLHHLLVTDRIPLPDIIDLAAELTTDALVIEFIGREDVMFRRLVRGREALFSSVAPELFEMACRRHFVIVRSQDLPEMSRTLYFLRRR